jgi:hypothetical protein
VTARGGAASQSRRLALELADLVDHFPAHLGRIILVASGID